MEKCRKNNLRPINPCVDSNILYYAIYGWTRKVFKTGFKRALSFSDLYEPLSEHSSAKLADDFLHIWDKYKKQGKPSLFKTILQCYKKQIIINFTFALILECVIKITQPILLGKLVSYYIPGQSNITKDRLYLYAFGVVLCSVLHVALAHPLAMSIVHLCMKYRVGCCSLIYRKALKLSKTALNQTTVGQVINLLSNDVGRFDVATILMNYLIIAPVQVIIMAIFMWYEIGLSGLIGVIILLSLIPFQIWLGKQASAIRMKTAKLTDNRLKIINEILLGIQIIKMYAWEEPFLKLVTSLRKKEMNKIKQTACIKSIVMSFGMFNTRFAMFCSVLSYVLLGNAITAEKIFILLSFYGALKHSLAVLFPQAITMLGEIFVTINRLQTFLLYKENNFNMILSNSEVDSDDQPLLNDEEKNGGHDLPFFGENSIKNIKLHVNWNTNENIVENRMENDLQKPNDDVPSIILKNVFVKWEKNSVEYTLSNINLNINPGSLTAIVGPVGAGKSSLFYTILKEVPVNNGNISINGSVAYASQEPWLFNSTVIQNITFGEDMMNNRYRDTIKMCSLDYDINLMPFGDQSIIGERGITLSGGQKSRINLARAVYRDVDIYLFDDPLSAVDAEIGRHIFNQCIVKHLKGKTRLLITHQPQYLSQVDHIIMIKDGTILAEGKYEHLQKNCEEFNKLIQLNRKNDDVKENINEQERRSDKLYQSISEKYVKKENQQTNFKETDEEKNSGTVNAYVYKSYVKSSGSILLFFILVLLILATQFFASGSDFWISRWVNQEESTNSIKEKNYTLKFDNDQFDILSFNNDTQTDGYYKFEHYNFSRETYTITYTILIILLVITTLLRSKMFFWMAIRASINLHNVMLKTIIHATMKFFYINPSGRIMNRFSKDVGSIDEILPSITMDVIQSYLQLFGVIIVILIINVWLIIPVMIMFGVCYYLQFYYLSTSRSLKRLEAIARSPIFVHLGSSLQGMTTIRAFNAQQTMIDEFDLRQDLHSSTWFMYLGTTRAFGMWLDLICITFIFIVTLTFVLIANDHPAGDIGLAISQAIGLTGMLQWGIRQSTEMENFMTCVERVLEYHEIRQEPAIEMPRDTQLPAKWPSNPQISFEKVYLKYISDGPYILSDLSFIINPKEKIGIIGRTGSGKSSIINALFRMVPTEGSIKIDGTDISTIGLHKLRSNISIIPQEPIMFSGNIRENIDPFGEYSDEIIWKALEEVELKQVILELSKGLDSKVAEGGSNFSVGQRQLFCLARAIVRGNQIIVLDEATANVDPQTDSLIQKTIRTKFSDCTILTIAHRLQSVMDSDKILVIDAGRLVEFGHPHVLLQNAEGALFNIIYKLDKDMSDHLISIAEENYRG